MEEKFEAEELSGEEDYDSEDLSDLEEGEDELEEEGLSESELDRLEAQENKDRDIEEAYKSTKGRSKKSDQSKKSQLLKKNPKPTNLFNLKRRKTTKTIFSDSSWRSCLSVRCNLIF